MMPRFAALRCGAPLRRVVRRPLAAVLLAAMGLAAAPACGLSPLRPGRPADPGEGSTHRPAIDAALLEEEGPARLAVDALDVPLPARSFEAQMLALLAEVQGDAALVAALGEAARRTDLPALARSLRAQLSYADAIAADPADINGPPSCRLRVPVDRSRPSVGANRSILQRILALVDEAHGLPLCNATFSLAGHTYPRCALFEVADLADFYVHALAGAAVLTLHFDNDSLISRNLSQPEDTWLPLSGSPMTWLSGVEGFTPTGAVDPRCTDPRVNCLSYTVSPHAAHRLTFATFDPAYDGSVLPSGAERTRWVLARARVGGVPYDERHGKTLFFWECDDLVGQLQPLMQAFVAHGRADWVVRAMRLMHAHWQVAGTDADGQVAPADSAGLVRAEPALAHMLNGGVRAALDALLPAGPEHTPSAEPAEQL